MKGGLQYLRHTDGYGERRSRWVDMKSHRNGQCYEGDDLLFLRCPFMALVSQHDGGSPDGCSIKANPSAPTTNNNHLETPSVLPQISIPKSCCPTEPQLSPCLEREVFSPALLAYQKHPQRGRAPLFRPKPYDDVWPLMPSTVFFLFLRLHNADLFPEHFPISAM